MTKSIPELDHSKGLAARQGDVMLIPVDDIPANAKPVSATDGVHVIAHSESGHNHQLSAMRVNCFQMPDNLLNGYLEVGESTVLEHSKSGPDQHGAIRVRAGKYKIVRQREMSPEGWQRAVD